MDDLTMDDVYGGDFADDDAQGGGSAQDGYNGLFVTILEYNSNDIVFVTPNDSTRDPFSRCELYFYDFTTY